MSGRRLARRVYTKATRPPERTRACASPVTCRGESSKRPGAIRSDRLLELLGGAERDLLARLDLDRLAGGRIATHARRALPDLQNAETADADAVALLQVLADVGHQVAQHRFGLLARHFMIFGEFRREITHCDGRLLCRRCLGHA